MMANQKRAATMVAFCRAVFLSGIGSERMLKSPFRQVNMTVRSFFTSLPRWTADRSIRLPDAWVDRTTLTA